ncbi:MAG: YbaB/EbfC family nucleoid-associated protein [Planctomycetaceae bacterium]|nr:YbaB/EbfC family nucleoid-associated protein [Planctomycetaceae bacterium]
MFDGLKNLGALLKQAQQLGGQMGKVSEEMRRRRVVGTAGGGMVELEVNGMMEALRCQIDPKLLNPNDRELLEDMVVAAVNQALTKGKQMHADAIRDMTGGLPLPGGLQDMLAKFAGEEKEDRDDDITA